MSFNLQNCLRRGVNQPMSDLHSLKVSCQNEPKFYVSLSSREEQDIDFPQAGNLIKQLFFPWKLQMRWFLLASRLAVVLSHPHGVQGPALVSESSLLSRTQCVLQFGTFLLHSPPPPLLCLWPCPSLPSARGFGSHGCAKPSIPGFAPHPLVLCQCQGGEHEAPAHSNLPSTPVCFGVLKDSK